MEIDCKYDLWTANSPVNHQTRTCTADARTASIDVLKRILDIVNRIDSVIREP